MVDLVAPAQMTPATALLNLQQLGPLLITSGTIVAMITLRNSDLASRMRSNRDRLGLTPAPSPRRARSLAWQNHIFFIRYLLLAASSISTVYGMLALSIPLVETVIGRDVLSHYPHIFRNVPGIKAVILGFLFFCIELCIGWTTLFLN